MTPIAMDAGGLSLVPTIEQIMPSSAGWTSSWIVPEVRSVPVPSPQPHALTMAGVPLWKTAVDRNLTAIAGLSAGWDGTRSNRIPKATISKVERLLLDALESAPNAAPPYIVPMAAGGVQIEWHTPLYELEFSIVGDTMSAWVRNHQTGAEIEGENGDAVGILFRWARRVASPVSDDGDVKAPPAEARVLLAA